jgi:flagellar protein FlbB
MGRILIRVIILLLFIAILAGGGLMWFDYLNIIDAKAYLAPVYRLIGLAPRTQLEQPADEFLSLDVERLAVRLEALDLRNMEIEKKEQELAARAGEIEQMAQDLEERQKALDERENSFNALTEDADIRTRNIEQNARYLTGMPPANAVAIIAAMNDQDAIDVFRKTEEIAQAGGTTSLVSVWLSMLPSDRAAELQRKMTERPQPLRE